MRVYYRCGTASGVAEVNDLDWRKGTVIITCSVCGTKLHQEDDHFNLEPFEGEEA